MSNVRVLATAEGMPALNRRRLLLGLAAASTAAAAITVAPAARSAPAENPELIRLGNALAAVEAAYVAANGVVITIIKEWAPRWPAAPKILLGFGYAEDRDFEGRGIRSKNRFGNDAWLRVATVNDLQWHIDTARRVLKGRSIDKRKIRGMTRAEWEEELSVLTRMEKTATKLAAKRSSVMAASGFQEAKAVRKAAFDQLAEIVMETMGHEAVTMDGVVIKAMAMDAWGRHAELPDMILTPGAATWGQQLAASVLRLAGEA